MTVVVGYLATPEGEAALETGVAEARRRDARVVVVISRRSRQEQHADVDAELDALRELGLLDEEREPPKGDATWCPLNFGERMPAGEDVLDAELVDRLLAVVNQRFSSSAGVDAMARVAMRDLAAGR